jgi:hypothetical protein
MSVFLGSRTIDGVQVTVDGQPIDPAFDLGTFGSGLFEWSYEGEGPMQLSLAILKEYHKDGQKALRDADYFMRAVVANLGNDWELTTDNIRDALSNAGR